MFLEQLTYLVRFVLQVAFQQIVLCSHHSTNNLGCTRSMRLRFIVSFGFLAVGFRVRLSFREV